MVSFKVVLSPKESTGRIGLRYRERSRKHPLDTPILTRSEKVIDSDQDVWVLSTVRQWVIPRPSLGVNGEKGGLSTD